MENTETRLETLNSSNLKMEPPRNVVLLPTRKRQSIWKSRKKMRRLLVIVALVIIVATISGVTIALARKSKAFVCNTKACKDAAASLKNSMDMSVDPCDDFYAFCCNGWREKNPIPLDTSSYGVTDKLKDELANSLRSALESVDLKTEKSDAVKKAFRFYQSCMNTTEIDGINGKGAREFLQRIGGWPLINKTWDGQGYTWHRILARVIEEIGTPLIIGLVIGRGENDTASNILQIQPASLSLDRNVLLQYGSGNDTELIQQYKKQIMEVAITLGSEGGNSLEKEVDDLVEFESNIAKFASNELTKTMTTIDQLQKNIPGTQWLEFFQLATNATMNRYEADPINKSEPLLVIDQDYFKRVVQYLNNTEARQIANYIGWRAIYPRLLLLPEGARNAIHNFSTSFYGGSVRPDRWKLCVGFVTSGMPYALTHLFSKTSFPQEAKSETENMVTRLKDVFTSLLQQNTWMDEETRSGALEKIENMKPLIGYPLWVLNNTEMDQYYESLDFGQDGDGKFDPFLMETKIAQSMGQRILITLRSPVERGEWTANPVVVNAYYSLHTNTIQFPAAILLPPLYEYNRPQYLNYGAIGSVIGHEITHGFDDKGRHRDSKGNLKEWWTESSSNTFISKTTCFVEQYDSYGVNGSQTLTENIADSGGLKESFLAYTTWMKEQHKKEANLPGFENFSHNQMFFISFGSMYCSNQTQKAYYWTLKNDVHSPSKYRVWGPVSNSEAFSKAFGCRKGQKMNPDKKCEIW